MNVHADLVLKARITLLSHNDRILDGEEGMRVYRTLFAVSPQVYAYKLAYVLRALAETSPRAARRPGAREELLAEARAASAHIPADAPAHQRRMWEHTVPQLQEFERRLGQANAR
ncbi:hypothetical protein ACIQWA_35605 [Kitasatospora sp. NPDC098652]|uniref:hypothetical protein n=1 Tax=Kitasatospora sp. NPDC098652 TaxID=3364095 RepID=UPI0037FABE8B